MTIVEGSMDKIKVEVSKNANYIFHMLSVSKCGYENSYGDTYASLHTQEDLRILKTNEEQLTVSGGEHIGVLYSVLVSTPANLESDKLFLDYLQGTKDLFLNEDPVSNYDKYKNVFKTAYSAHKFSVTLQSSIDFFNHLKDLKTSIIEMCDVLINNYSVYKNIVWEESKKEIENKKSQLEDQLILNIEKEWECLMDHKYPYKDFQVVLCNSINGGTQAIDIGYNMDVIDSRMDVSSIIQFTSHEYGIFLLKDKLNGLNKIDFYSHYDVIESVIEFYNPIKNEKLVFSDSQYKINEFIEETLNIIPKISIDILIQRVIEFVSKQVV
jgi:hypothetical protein